MNVLSAAASDFGESGNLLTKQLEVSPTKAPLSIRYSAGRGFAILTKPLWLFVANNYAQPGLADALALTYLCSALAMATIATDPHRRFYPRYLQSPNTAGGVHLFTYLTSIGLLLVVGSIAAVILATVAGARPLSAVAMGLYFTSEKIADEVLRLRLFEDRLGAWGDLSVRRMVLQLAMGLPLIFVTKQLPTWAFVATLACANLAAFSNQIPYRVLWRTFGRSRRFVAWLLTRSARSLARNIEVWVLALLSVGLPYLDRCTALIVDRQMFALFMLVATCMSVVQIGIDYFFVSRNRRAYLEKRLTAGAIFHSRAFSLCLGIGLATGVTSAFVALSLSKGGHNFPVGYVVAIAAVQASLAAVFALRELLYWQGRIRSMLLIDAFFYLVFGLTFAACWLLAASPGWFFGALVVGATARFAMYYRIALIVTPTNSGSARNIESEMSSGYCRRLSSGLASSLARTGVRK